MANDILRIKDLNYNKNRKHILENVNLNIGNGKIVGLLGENGAGKTTLMRIISGINLGETGSVSVGGKYKASERKSQVSFSDALAGFRGTAKIKNVINFYQTVYPDFLTSRYKDLEKFLSINEDNHLSQLSSGMKEKLVIALALSRQVSLYLLDEPFDGIDLMSRKRIIKSIINWKGKDSTLIISDHYVSEIAKLLDEIVVIKNKTIFTQQSAENIRENKKQSIEDYYMSLYEKEGDQK